jgi:hypothetical protein
MLEGFFTSAASTFMTAENGNGVEDTNGQEGNNGGSGFEEHDGHKFEGFSPMYGPAMGHQGDLAGMIGRVLALIFVLLLISFFGQYFWNNYVTSLLTIAKPAKSVMQILGLFIFVRLMFP